MGIRNADLERCAQPWYKRTASPVVVNGLAFGMFLWALLSFAHAYDIRSHGAVTRMLDHFDAQTRRPQQHHPQVHQPASAGQPASVSEQGPR